MRKRFARHRTVLSNFHPPQATLKQTVNALPKICSLRPGLSQAGPSTQHTRSKESAQPQPPPRSSNPSTMAQIQLTRTIVEENITRDTIHSKCFCLNVADTSVAPLAVVAARLLRRRFSRVAAARVSPENRYEKRYCPRDSVSSLAGPPGISALLPGLLSIKYPMASENRAPALRRIVNIESSSAASPSASARPSRT